MKLPFVARATLDLVTAAKDQQVQDLRLALHRSEERAAAAEAKYHDLTLRHAVSVKMPITVPRGPDVDDSLDLVSMAIAEQTTSDPALARYLHTWKSNERLKAKRGDAGALSEADLLHKVTHWESGANESVYLPRSPEVVERDLLRSDEASDDSPVAAG